MSDIEEYKMANELLRLMLDKCQAELASIKQQVVFVDEGVQPEVGDLVQWKTRKDTPFESIYYRACNKDDIEQGFWAYIKREDGEPTIILRNNQPVLVRK